MKKIFSFLSLFASFGTLVCCALPALLVALGLGAVVAGIVSNVPQLIWLSEHKGSVFSTAAGLLLLAGFLQWRARRASCPVEPSQAQACAVTRDYSVWIYWISVGLFLIGVVFAYGLGA